MFWLIAVTMVLLALLIVVLPLIRKQDAVTLDDARQRNINIARERLAELKANKTAGGISAAQYEEQVAELELALNDDLSIISTSAKPVRQGRWLAYVLILAIPLLSGLLYALLGNYAAINRVDEPQQADRSTKPSVADINNMVAKLAAKMKAEPNNYEGWLMLGRSYKVLERYQESIEAFEHAYQLVGDKTDVLLPYAEVLALAKNGDWSGKPIVLIDKALSLEPKNLAALFFAAIAYNQQGGKSKAVVYLRKLNILLPQGSADQQQIQKLIAETEKEPDKSEPTAPAQASNAASLSVAVSIAVELQNQVNKEDTVFIYAQALTGPKMPIAIVKKQVADLPVTISLNDADGMMPNMKLSNFKEVRLVARISKSGNAMPQTGDFIGEIGQVSVVDSASHKLVINHRLD